MMTRHWSLWSQSSNRTAPRVGPADPLRTNTHCDADEYAATFRRWGDARRITKTGGQNMDQHLTLSIFEGCGRRERAVIGRVGTVVNVGAGQRLSTQGAPQRQFAVVLDGELAVTRDSRRVATLRGGDCVGEIALLCGPNASATATVEATTATSVWVLSSMEFEELVHAVPRVVNRLNHLGLTRAAQNAAT